MTAEQFALRLEKGKLTGYGKGTGCCPAHEDRHPSLTFCEAEDRLLVYCFGGCCIENICSALDLELKDLFFNSTAGNGQAGRSDQPCNVPNHSPHETARMYRQYSRKLETIADDYYQHSEAVLAQARGICIDNCSAEELDEALEIVDRAFQCQRLLPPLEDLAFELKSTALNIERKFYEFKS